MICKLKLQTEIETIIAKYHKDHCVKFVPNYDRNTIIWSCL